MTIETKFQVLDQVLYFDREKTRLHPCRIIGMDIKVSNWSGAGTLIQYSIDRIAENVGAEDCLQAYLSNKDVPVIKTDATNLFKDREEFMDYVSGKRPKKDGNT